LQSLQIRRAFLKERPSEETTRETRLVNLKGSVERFPRAFAAAASFFTPGDGLGMTFGMRLAILEIAHLPFPRDLDSEVPHMSARKRRKIQGVRREHRRPRGWTRWFRDGLLEAEPAGGVRLRTTLWGAPWI
jgi:hypothetical protein